jgi:hypothetical protein
MTKVSIEVRRGDGSTYDSVADVTEEAAEEMLKRDDVRKYVKRGGQTAETTAVEPAETREAPPYEEWTVEDLRAEASVREIEGRSELTTKADLIKALKKDDKG